jgi:cytochrome c55X
MWRHCAACLLSLFAATAQGGEAAPGPERQTELLSILQQDCGSCHGSRLKGGLGPSLLPDALAGKPAEALVATIRAGRPGTAMPPWGPILKESEIRWLVEQMLAGRGAAQ